MGIDFNLPPGATPIDPNEAEGLLPQLTTQLELNEFESDNIRKAELSLYVSKKASVDLLNPFALRSIHRQMFDESWTWAGSYRKTQKSIGVEAYKIPSELQSLCDDTATWIELITYPPDEILARFHHRLVAIHPFPNGNGRFSRLATDLLCRKLGWPAPTWGSANLDQTTEARKRYIRALRAADNHDIQPLIRFIRS